MEEFWTAPERGRPARGGGRVRRRVRPIVFSDSLELVAPGCQLVRRADAVDEVVRLKIETDGDLAVAATVWLHRWVDLTERRSGAEEPPLGPLQ